jgi:hypothetical protein
MNPADSSSPALTIVDNSADFETEISPARIEL